MGPFSVGLIVSWFFLINVANLQEIQSCSGEKIPHVSNGQWECHDDDDGGLMCRIHCTLTCNPGYVAPDKDSLECDYSWQSPGCKWCAFDKDASGEVGDNCHCNGCDWYEPGQNDFSCIQAEKGKPEIDELQMPKAQPINQLHQPDVLIREEDNSGVVACSEKNENCVSHSGDNVIFTGTVGSEAECQFLCGHPDVAPDCQAYTYHANTNKCYLLRKCSHGQCNHCHSGPKECFCEKPMNPNEGGNWDCKFTADLDQGWTHQYTDCDLICSSRGTSDHIDCKDQQWNPPPENFNCDPEPPETESCSDVLVPHVENGKWDCNHEDIRGDPHCTLKCNAGYTTKDKDTLECDWTGGVPVWAWCALNWATAHGDVGTFCHCESCEWYEEGDTEFICISEGCESTFPDESIYSGDSWACMAGGLPVNPGETLVEGTECRRRCGQGQISQGSYKCQENAWTGEPDMCVNNEQELLYFYTTKRDGNQFMTSIENPQNSNFLDAGVFTSKRDGLHLFALTLPTGAGADIQLKHNNEVIATIPKDATKTNSLAVAVNLAINDKVKIEGDGDLTFTGVSLYSLSHIQDSKSLWGSGIQEMDVQNMDQPIILETNDGNGVNYDENTGSVKIETGGVYMVTLNLGSDGSSYASLDINNNKTLGLGEDRDGRNTMSNFILKEFKAGDTIQPTLEALSKIYDDKKQTQLTVTSLINEVKDWSFCAYSSDHNELQTLETVKFDQMFLLNGNFSTTTGIYTHPHEAFNPKRFYLLSATAFIGKLKDYSSATIQIEQEKEHGFISIASATTSSAMRSMLQVTVIAQMDQDNDKIRVRAEGFMDEGPDDVHFTTFCGIRLGG